MGDCSTYFLQFIDLVSSQWATFQLLICCSTFSSQFQTPGPWNRRRKKLSILNEILTLWHNCTLRRAGQKTLSLRLIMFTASSRAVAASKEAPTASILFCSIPAAYRRSNSKGYACASWWWQAAGNPGSSIPSLTALHNDPLLDSPRPCESLLAPPTIHERSQHCQGENNEASIKQNISWPLRKDKYFWLGISQRVHMKLQLNCTFVKAPLMLNYI